VPIVEPEILLDGDHDIDRTLEIAEMTWAETFKYLADNNVLFEGILLKPSMVTPGAEHAKKSSPEEVRAAGQAADDIVDSIFCCFEVSISNVKLPAAARLGPSLHRLGSRSTSRSALTWHALPPHLQVASYTLNMLRRRVPPAVPGIMFLSGGQSELESTLNLNAMNQSPNPWHVSFSYARALQVGRVDTLAFSVSGCYTRVALSCVE
jgi:fructose-bisphosphate aldolase class 1